MSWIDIKALHDPAVIEASGKMFGIHPLVLEDILNTNQRPKIEYSENQLFIVLKMLSWNEKEHLIEAEQISLILGRITSSPTRRIMTIFLMRCGSGCGR